MKSLLNFIPPLFLFAILIIPLRGKAQDTASLKKHVRDQFDIEYSLELTYSSFDIYTEREKKEKREELSFAKIDELLDSVKINSDGDMYFRIGNMYEKLNRETAASKYYAEALKIYKETLKKTPGDSSVMASLVMLNMQTGNIDEAITYTRKLIAAYPDDTVYHLMLPYLYIFKSDFENTNKYADISLEKYPDIPDTYLYKTFALVFPEISKMQNTETLADGSKVFDKFNIDLSFLSAAAEKYPSHTDIQMAVLCSEYFVFFYQQIVPVFFNYSFDSPEPLEFHLSSDDSLQLVRFEEAFKTFMHKDDFNNLYPIYYSLGTVKVLQNDFSQAILHFKKAIKQRGDEYSDETDNTYNAYANIEGCYMFLKDTINAEKWMQKRIDDKPAIYPVAIDYVKAGLFKLIKNDIGAGRDLMNKAIETDSSCYQAFVYLANISMLEDNYNKAGEYLATAYAINNADGVVINAFILQSLFLKDIATAKYLTDKLLAYNPENEFAMEIKQQYLDK